MRNLLVNATILLFIVGYTFLKHAHAQENWLWAKQIKAAGGGNNSIATDALGNLFVAGLFDGEIDLDGVRLNSNGIVDLFLAKYDSLGNLLWAVQANGGPFENEGLAITTDPKNRVFIAGSYGHNASYLGRISLDILRGNFLAGYDQSGRFINLLMFGSGVFADNISSIASDTKGDILITGSFSAPYFKFGNNIRLENSGRQDLFVAQAKPTPTGTIPLWAFNRTGRENDVGKSVTADGFDNYVVTGRTTGVNRQFEKTAQIVTFKSGENPWGETIPAAARFAGSDSHSGIEVTTDARANVYATGNFVRTTNNVISRSDSDIFLKKFSPDGTLLWEKTPGGFSEDRVFGMATDRSGNSFIIGRVRNTVFFDNDTLNVGPFSEFMAKYDSAGNVAWVRLLDERASDIAADNFGTVYITGSFSGTIVFNGLTLDSEGRNDVFIAKLGEGMPTSVAEIDTRPHSFNLSQNFPNPFNPSTTIVYSLSQSANVRLKIYNIVGGEIETLIEKEQTAGEYRVHWEPKNLPSGLYIYRLQAGRFSEAKKLILLP